MELAEGEVGCRGLGARAHGNEFCGDSGDQGVGWAEGEGLNFLVGRRDGDAVFELQAEQAGVEPFDEFGEPARGLDAEDAVERQLEQAVLAPGADALRQRALEGVEAIVGGEAVGELVPAEAAGRHLEDPRHLAAGGRHDEEVAGVVVGAFREAVDFRGAGIPSLGADLFGAVPIA